LIEIEVIREVLGIREDLKPVGMTGQLEVDDQAGNCHQTDMRHQVLGIREVLKPVGMIG
jgi:hypothetical protein